MTKKAQTRKNEFRELSPRRKRLFTLLIVLFPFLMLSALEIGLRVAEYGGDLNLVVTKNIRGKEFSSINRDVAKRYFAHAGTTIPEPHDETFELVKQPNTKRIFCIGESTMEGFPYEYHATPPGFLGDRLRALLPQYNIEVINVGLSAVGSYVVLDFMKELMAYQPDLFVVYVGHNEFYGAYGVGSAITIAGAQWMTRATLSLLKYKTFLLLRDGYANVRSLSPSNNPAGSLMQQMAATQTIPYGSPLYNQARDIYKENLQRIIAEARSHAVPILFSTLVSNEKDQAPFVSDAFNADSLFALGKKLYDERKYDDAHTAFIRAKDYDALRFRMAEEFQDLLVSVCREQSVPVARTDSLFIAHSPHGSCGEELFLEHLHPNVNGYFLMAKSFANAMRNHGLAFARSDWREESSIADSTLMEISTVGEFDRTVGKLKTDFLKRRWPFNKGAVNHKFDAANPIESFVFKYLQKEIIWSDARYMLADYYAKNKRFDLARKECRAVSKVIPFHYNPLLRIADYYRMEGKRDEAKAAYKRCLAVEENPYAHVKLGLALLEEENAAEAASELEAALTSNESFSDPFSTEASSGARYLLGVAYAKMGRIQEAKDQLNRALAINPNNQDAKEVLKQLP